MDINVFHHTGDLITDGWFDWLIQNNCQYISPKFWRTLGYDPLSKKDHFHDWQKLIDKKDLSFFKKEYDKHIKTKGKYELSVPVRFLHFSGETKWFIFRGKVIQWYNDKPIRMIGTYTDITNFKRIQESFEKMNLAHEIIENVIDGVSFDIALSYEDEVKSESWQNLEKTFGLSKEEIFKDFGENYWDQFFSKVDEAFKDIVKEKFNSYIAKRKSYFESEFIFNTSSGKKWFRCISYMFYYKDTYRIIGIFRNINPYKVNKILYEEERYKFKALFDNSPACKIIVDTEGLIKKINKATTEFFNRSEEQIIGRNFRDFFIGFASENKMQNLEKEFDIHNVYFNKEEFKNQGIEIKYVSDDGKEIWGLTKFVEIQNIVDDVQEILYTVIDISKQKDEEAKKDVMLKELSQFVSIASHDLQEPLRQIYNYSELLEESLSKSNLLPDQKKYLNFIKGGSEHAIQLVQDLLRFSRADKSNEETYPVEILEIVQGTIHKLDRLKNKKNGEIVIENPDDFPILNIHKIKIEQVFFNLIHNALKYGGNPPVIRISCEKKDNKFLFKIKDNGKGIDLEYDEKIFEIFFRLDSQNEGTGIGLAICKKTIDFYKENIWVEKNQNEPGSCFMFTLKDFV